MAFFVELGVYFHRLLFAARSRMICERSAGLSRAQNALTAWLAAACFYLSSNPKD
jgi:hypothetical protein